MTKYILARWESDADSGDVAYLSFLPAPVPEGSSHTQLRVSGGLILDFNIDGRLIGIEFLDGGAQPPPESFSTVIDMADLQDLREAQVEQWSANDQKRLETVTHPAMTEMYKILLRYVQASPPGTQLATAVEILSNLVGRCIAQQADHEAVAQAFVVALAEQVAKRLAIKARLAPGSDTPS